MLIWALQDYIQVEIENGLNFHEIADAIEDLSNMPDCFSYLMVRVRTSKCSITYLQLGTIIEETKKKLRSPGRLEKIALVLNTRLQSGMAWLFLENMNGLASLFGVFRDHDQALGWLFKDKPASQSLFTHPPPSFTAPTDCFRTEKELTC